MSATLNFFPGIRARATRVDNTFDAYFASAGDDAKEESEPRGAAGAAEACAECGVPREDWTFDELYVCKGCGVVMERPIDSGAEYRFFGLEERGGGDPCRVGRRWTLGFPPRAWAR